jgi:putative ABC transport system permease protein
MKYLPILLSGFRRHRLRLVLTILSIAVAFILFAYLAAVKKAFSMGIEVAGADRLVVRHKVSIIQMLPTSYEADIEAIDGVSDATPQTWFGGVYQDPKNFFPQIPVKPEEFLRMYPEFVLTDEERATFTRVRIAAIAGEKIAKRFDWKVGDRIPLQATIWRPKGGGNTWEFELAGIYTGATPETDTSQFFFRYDYFDENRAFGQGMIGWYIIRVEDPARAVEISKAIDATFENSPAETKTETEGAFVKAFADQVGNIGAIVVAILTAVFFTILLVVGNTMAQSVRERTGEIGVFKALGFSDLQILMFVLGESLLISIAGGAIGLLLGSLAVGAGDPTGGALAVFYFPANDLVLGVFLVLALGFVTGLLPAIQAMRLDPVDALRRE